MAGGTVPGYLRADHTIGARAARTSLQLAAANGTHDGEPVNAQSFTATGVSGLSSESLAFDLAVDAQTAVGQAAQARVSVDLTGDGTVDRTITYRYFATDPVAGIEHYTNAQGVLASTGTAGTLRNGTVRLEVWTALGSSPVSLTVGDASTVGGTPTDGPGGGSTGSASPTPTAPTSGLRYLRSDTSIAGAQPGGIVTLTPAGGEHDGQPANAVTFTATGVSASSADALAFDLAVDARAAVGQAVQARLAIDRTSDGSIDQTITYRYFATDPTPGWERYTSAAGVRSSTGTSGPLTNATVTLQLWCALGSQPVDIGVGDRSTLRIG